MINRTITVIFTLLCVAFAAQASEFKDTDLTGAQMPNSRVEIMMDNPRWDLVKKQIAPATLEEILCTGSERMRLPVTGKCPVYPGYTTIGVAVCTQAFDVPRTFTFEEIVPGWSRMVCTFDYDNAVPVGQPTCDYSRCILVEEPSFPQEPIIIIE